MDFNDMDDIKRYGFSGFKKVSELFEDLSAIPKEKGVYLVLNMGTREYLDIGTGGHFKGKNPNVSIEELNSNWVDDAMVVYIGKAGKNGGKATLHSRLKQYVRFGQCRNVGHWGGRLIWQLKNSGDLIICWKTLSNDDPRRVEQELIQTFISKYASRPFANLIN